MSKQDRARTELHERLDDTMGQDAADTLMGYLPPVGWADVATKRDLDAATALTKAEIHAEFGLMRAEMRQELRSGLSELRTELQTDINQSRTDVGELRAEMRTGFANVEARFERSLRQHLIAVVGTVVAATGTLLAISQAFG